MPSAEPGSIGSIGSPSSRTSTVSECGVPRSMLGA